MKITQFIKENKYQSFILILMILVIVFSVIGLATGIHPWPNFEASNKAWLNKPLANATIQDISWLFIPIYFILALRR